VKTRILAGNQQVVRVDREDTDDVSCGDRRSILKTLEAALKSGKIKAVILEDYAKGLFSKPFMGALVELCKKYKVMSALDPHPHNPFNIKGMTFMTPNRNEAFSLAGIKYSPNRGNPLQDAPLLNVASRLMRRWHPQYLLITLGANGMALFSEDMSSPLHIPTQARQVFDVSGAGDTVMATMMLALMSGAEPEVAAQIANQAAGVVVGRVGTSAIEIDVLRETLK
jgi:D-beta-D-heptose 7-phosphate kinase/D-beta-D-heptose 1-phosphate adenosyltransferase